MNITLGRKTLCLGIILLLAALPISMSAQTTPATSTVNYAGGGALQAGDVSDSFLPQGTTPSSGEVGSAATLGVRQFIRFGNFDRNWTTPNMHWPAAFPWTNYWARYMMVMEYNPDSSWNRSTIGGKANPSYFAGAAGNSAGLYSPYAQLTYHTGLNGVSDPARKYAYEPYWVDGNRRQHSVYDAGWPTNLGLDIKMRAHSFQGPNWGNLNDFIILEVSFKNTGLVDLNFDGKADSIDTNGDGKVDALNDKNIIKSLAVNMAGQVYMAISSYAGGGRNVNSAGLPPGRQAAWVNDPDPNGNPWAFSTHFPSANSFDPPAGKRDMGFNAWTTKNYTDIWTGWVWLDAKQGGLNSDPSKSVTASPTKTTIFGTHPIGVGPERGWYVSGGESKLGMTTGNPKTMHILSTAAFYKDAGRSQQVDLQGLNLSPNPNFFQSGTDGNILTFVPKPAGQRGRPDGDLKSADVFDQVSFEDGSADATTKYPNGYGKFSKGHSRREDFDADMMSSVGPFEIKKDSTITVVLAMVAGFRLEGIQRAVEAARWTYERNLDIPVLPPLPDMTVNSTSVNGKSVLALEWDNKAESEPGFGGYKIWRSTQALRKKYLEEGMRLADRYQEQNDPKESKEPLKKPVNPKFDAYFDINATSTRGEYQCDTWGTWELVKNIPKADLASVDKSTTTGYNYKYIDNDVSLGLSYFYYVSAYKTGTFTGPGGQTTTQIETHSTNRNGASGLWKYTFPFAFNNANFGKMSLTETKATPAGLKNIGGVISVQSPRAAVGDLGKVGVRPNPYKRTAFHDNSYSAYDHKLLFYNLPPEATITIADVSGQIIDVIPFSSSDPNKGSFYWDMFSKDGLEVASGLYIYVVESSGQKFVGHFAILR